MISDKLEQYIEQHTTAEESFLKNLNRQTHLQQLAPHMISGHYQGVYLQQISRIKQPKTILEIGTFTGYSALCLVKGLQPNGELHTIDIDAELMEQTRATFNATPYGKQIITHVGDAKQIVNNLDMNFDLVFIDADKLSYAQYYDMVINKVSSGGIILADNILWKGQVLNEKKSKRAAVLDEFNKKVVADERVLSCCLPFRDGLMQIIKK